MFFEDTSRHTQKSSSGYPATRQMHTFTEEVTLCLSSETTSADIKKSHHLPIQQDNCSHSQKSSSTYSARQGGDGDSQRVQVKKEHCGK